MMTTTEPQDPAGRITQAELARRLGVSRPSVCKAVKTGRIKTDEDGLLDPVQAELDWLANTRPKAAGVTQKGATGYAEARTRKENALARMAELRLAQATGNLVERAHAEFVMADAGAALASLLENLPDRLAPQLSVQRDLASIRRLLDAAFTDLREELANHLMQRAHEYFP